MSSSTPFAAASSSSSPRPLSLSEYQRYGRQMIMPGFGLPGQLRLKNAKVAVVGAGGLGCPLLQYLAGAGVGTIAIFDHDTVSLSNLHRQVLHTTERVGMNKAQSALLALRALNPEISILPIDEAITPSNSLALLRPYHLLIDCTDRPMTRYLLSHTATILDIPLISGAAISNLGQWAIYGGIKKDGKKRACYRCIWPKVVSGGGGEGACEEVGVWGAVVGMVGVAMAGEVVKLLIGQSDDEPLLHLLHLGNNPLVRSVRMKGPSKNCVACGEQGRLRGIAEKEGNLEEMGYEAFCAGVGLNGNGESERREEDGVERINVKEFASVLKDTDRPQVVIDTRPEVEYGICALPNSTNMPLESVLANPALLNFRNDSEIICICRQGNDSLIAARVIKSAWPGIRVRDVKGGLVAWSKDVDGEFPIY